MIIKTDTTFQYNPEGVLMITKTDTTLQFNPEGVLMIMEIQKISHKKSGLNARFFQRNHLMKLRSARVAILGIVE